MDVYRNDKEKKISYVIFVVYLILPNQKKNIFSLQRDVDAMQKASIIAKDLLF